MLSSGMKCYHLGLHVIIWDAILSSGANVIIWDEMLSSRIKRYHLELMLSSGTKCYHLGLNVIMWDAVLSSGANVIMLQSGANVIIWCYHVMLLSGMIIPLFFIFPENFTHSLYSSTNPHIHDLLT